MVAITDINDRESLQAWLEETNQPREACIALAHRAAMRVMAKTAGWYQQFSHSPLPVFRALLVAGVSGRTLASGGTSGQTLSDLRRAAGSAARAAAHSIAADPVFAPNYVVADAAFASSGEAYRYGDEKDIDWLAVQSDCIELLAGNLLIELPIQNSLSTSDLDFSISERLMSTGYEFWIDWYDRALAGEPQPWPLLLEIAIREDAFWQGSDDEVMARINEIVERHEAAGAEVNPQALNDPRTAAVDPEAVRQLQARIAAVHPALTFNAHAVLEEIAQFRKEVRSDNQLGAEHPEFRDGLLDFLDRLASTFTALLDRLPEPTEEVSEQAARDALTWRERFAAGLAVEFGTYIAPEAMAKTTVPAALIFGLGGIGALLGGPLGFGAGALAGQLLVGHAKAGAAADRLEKSIKPDEDGSSP